MFIQLTGGWDYTQKAYTVSVTSLIHMSRVFALHMNPVCTRCGRPIAYCEVGKEDGKAV